MFRASSAHLQEDRVVHMQHMVLSLSMRGPGGLSVHSLSVILPYSACIQLYPREDEHLSSKHVEENNIL